MNSPPVLVVPLRSNAHTLVTGAPIAALRRRLKVASLFFERIYLEAGVLHAYAGPHGSSSFVVPPSPDLNRWQTPGQRHEATGTPFSMSVGLEDAPGTPAKDMHTVIQSDTSVAWEATLHPFEHELPSDCDWIEFVTVQDSDGSARKLKSAWNSHDERSKTLERALPIHFVRKLVVDHTNHDLSLATVGGVSASLDRLHLQVVKERYQAGANWKFTGYVVPILFPDAGDLPWDAIVDLRRDSKMVGFREVLAAVENDVESEALSGDIEAAAHHVYERRLADAVGRLDNAWGAARRFVGGVMIGGAAGVATSAITGPGSIAAGAALGAVPGAVLDVRNVVRQRRSRGWVAIHHRLAN